MEYAVDTPATLLVTQIEMGGGRSEQIAVKQGEDPHLVAYEFCIKHGLPPEIAKPLADHLLSHLGQCPTSAEPAEASALPHEEPCADVDADDQAIDDDYVDTPESEAVYTRLYDNAMKHLQKAQQSQAAATIQSKAMSETYRHDPLLC
jgi:hypothetical protein